MQTQIRCRVLRHLIWVCTICLCPKHWTLGLCGLRESALLTGNSEMVSTINRIKHNFDRAAGYGRRVGKVQLQENVHTCMVKIKPVNKVASRMLLFYQLWFRRLKIDDWSTYFKDSNLGYNWLSNSWVITVQVDSLSIMVVYARLIVQVNVLYRTIY